jgi:hypothetical protein
VRACVRTAEPNTKVMMMGQPEAVIAATDAATAAAAQPQDDFDAGAEEDGALDVRSRYCAHWGRLWWFGWRGEQT